MERVKNAPFVDYSVAAQHVKEYVPNFSIDQLASMC